MQQLNLFGAIKWRVLVNGHPMQPTNGEPYEYDTYWDAWNIVRICYGEWEIGKSIKIEKIKNI